MTVSVLVIHGVAFFEHTCSVCEGDKSGGIVSAMPLPWERRQQSTNLDLFQDD